MPRYYVVTPQYGQTIPILDDGSGPEEWDADVIEVEARTKRAAIIKGVKLMLMGNRREHRWCRDCRRDGMNPFKGVKAIPVEDDDLNSNRGEL